MKLKSREQLAREYVEKCRIRDEWKKSATDKAIEWLAWGVAIGFAIILLLAHTV